MRLRRLVTALTPAPPITGGGSRAVLPRLSSYETAGVRTPRGHGCRHGPRRRHRLRCPRRAAARPRGVPRPGLGAAARDGRRRLPRRRRPAVGVAGPVQGAQRLQRGEGAGARALVTRADRPGRDRADQLLRHLRQLPEPQELPAAVLHDDGGPAPPQARPLALLRQRAGDRAPHGLRRELGSAVLRLHLPALPAAGAAEPRGLAGVVAQPDLRLLVRDRELPDLDARDDQLLHDPDDGAELLVPLALP